MHFDHSKLVPFDYTYILYSPEHILSLPIAAASLLPIVILIFLFTWHVTTRELEPCLFAFGHVVNDLISGIVKKLVKYPRPLNGQIFKNDSGLEWGMPSSHSQFMAFWLVYVILQYIKNWPYYQLDKFWKTFFTQGSLTIVSLVVLSRLVFEYHNLNQVIVGLLLGSTLASIYFVIVCVFREYGVFDTILAHPIFKWWNMKDGFGRGQFNHLHTERLEWERTTYA